MLGLGRRGKVALLEHLVDVLAVAAIGRLAPGGGVGMAKQPGFFEAGPPGAARPRRPPPRPRAGRGPQGTSGWSDSHLEPTGWPCATWARTTLSSRNRWRSLSSTEEIFAARVSYRGRRAAFLPAPPP